MSIQILPSDVVNQIAAGEVLERPANLVKELVENSIDASATDIEVDIDEGGRFLRIKDNGLGMASEDLEKAILRHATSKIQKFSDLWSLGTYGFRGEALASAAAVSQMTLQSRTAQHKQASVLKSQFGVIEKIYEQSGDLGTTITVQSLFENVPARLKFLKTESAEVSQILKVIKAFALSNPQISFKVRNKNILKIFYGKASSFLERVQTVLEQKDLFEVSDLKGSQKLRAVYSSPNQVNRTSQNIWIFVQNRWIQDRALQKAILDSYQNLLMHGEYPTCVLYFECDPQVVDVNIHPAKSQIKFQNASDAFRSVYYLLRTELEKAPWLKSLFSSNTKEADLQSVSNKNSITSAVESYSESYEQNQFASSSPAFSTAHFKQKKSSLDSAFKNELQSSNAFYSENVETLSAHNLSTFELSPTENSSFSTSALPEQTAAPSLEGIGFEPHWSSLQVLGQLNQTYILAQSRTSLFLVDQHASHERVLFERLMTSLKNEQMDIQSYLIPLSIDLSAERIEALLNFKAEFQKLGIELEVSSPESISIYSAPSFIKEKALMESIIHMSHDILDMGGGFQLQKKIGDIFSTMACHSAVRAGQALSLEEMSELLVQMDRYPLSSFCPHGRPVFKQISFHELDKDFGRIV